MNPRTCTFLLAAVILTTGSAIRAAQPQPDKRPNFVLCMTDDQGWGDVGYNGLKQVATPNLDAMAAAGIRFNRFYAAYSVCSPTRGSVMTGRHPLRFGCFLYGYSLRPEERTTAQVVQAAGYSTGHFGKWHLNGVSGAGKVIAADDPLSPGKFGFDEWLSVSNFFDLDWTLSRKGTPEKFRGDGSEYIVAEALKFMAQAAAQKRPFLAVIWFGNPHSPHKALPEDQAAAGGSAYHGEIRAIDRSMGRLRAGLREAGVADHTLVCFCSDNGAIGPGSTGGLRGKKGSIMEGGVRVPGIIEWPARVSKPFVTEVPVVTSDLYPTTVDLVGLKLAKPVPIDGISLVPLLDGKMTERPRPIGFWQHGGAKDGKAFTKDSGHAAWTDNRFKLHKFAAARYELYDLMDDPSEKRNLAAEKPEVVDRMNAALGVWQESVLKSYRGEDYQSAKADP
jgi:arylsulfatase A-like enzyme